MTEKILYCDMFGIDKCGKKKKIGKQSGVKYYL